MKIKFRPHDFPLSLIRSTADTTSVLQHAYLDMGPHFESAKQTAYLLGRDAQDLHVGVSPL